MSMKIQQVKFRTPQLIKLTRVAAYARVSVDFEETELSLDNQVSHFMTKISGNPLWEFAGVYSDLGVSGTLSDRKGFTQLMTDAREGKMNLILTKSISRFARNTVTLLSAVRELKALGIGVIFERENINTLNAEGELLLTLLASFAQEESRSLSENVKWAIDKRYQNGIPNVYILYGYRWTDRRFEIEESEAETVKEVFFLYLDGSSPHEIAKQLTAAGKKTRTDSLRFHESKVWEILRCEAYTGNTVFHREYIENHLSHKKVENRGARKMYYAEDVYPAIIGREIFTEARNEIARRAELGYLANKNKRFSCFTGHLFCAKCGKTYRRKMQYQKSGTRYFWQCGTKFKGTGKACDAGNITEKLLIELSNEVLGKKELDEYLFREKVEKIIAGPGTCMTFVMKDGSEVKKEWQTDNRGRVVRKEVIDA